jgi:peptidoglycan/LPS O-acetylase OafA/YrhL
VPAPNGSLRTGGPIPAPAARASLGPAAPARPGAREARGHATAGQAAAQHARIDEIDGIRGWAALVVLLFHLTWELYGATFPALRAPWLKFPLDGTLAVFVFFVLSGDALSNAYLRRADDGSLARMVAKRWFRLAGPILLASVLVYLLMRAGLVFNREAATVVGREDWMGDWLAFEPGLRTLLDFAFVGAFALPSAGPGPAVSYGPFLWPMGIELVGSMAVFASLPALRRMRRPLEAVLAVAAFLAWYGSWYALFFIGVALAMLRERGAFERLRAMPAAGAASALGVVAVVAADAWSATRGHESVRLDIAFATLLVFCVYANARATAMMRGAASRWLGRVSFPLYLTHFAVIVSFTSWAVLASADSPHPVAAAAAVVAASVAVALAVAEVFARVESRYLVALDRTVRRAVA